MPFGPPERSATSSPALPIRAAGAAARHWWSTFWEISHSLRFRLTFWNTAVVFLVIVLTLIGVRTAVWIALLHEVEQLLVDDLAEMRLTVESLWPDLSLIKDELERKAITHTHRGLYVKLIRADGEVIFKTSTSPDDPIVPLDVTASFGPLTVDEYRMAQQQIIQEGMPTLTVRAGTSLNAVLDELNKLTRLMLTVGIILLIIAPLGGYWLANRAIQPVKEIIDTTGKLRPEALDERRLPIRGSRDELDQLSETVNYFIDRIATYVNQSRHFTADAAHELRSPLTAIQSLLEVTLNSDRSIEEYKDAINSVLEECDRLRGLVNQLLTLAEVDREHITPETDTIALDEIVRKSCDMFQAVAETSGINLDVYLEPAVVRGDSGRLRQVMINLLDNAMKFTHSGGRVLVQLRTDPEKQEVTLVVADSGVGIDDLDLPYIFDRFYRGDKSRQRDAHKSGTGLGLSIVQSTVSGHGGQVRVESRQGEGTKFIIQLPLASEVLHPAGVEV